VVIHQICGSALLFSKVREPDSCRNGQIGLVRNPFGGSVVYKVVYKDVTALGTISIDPGALEHVGKCVFAGPDLLICSVRKAVKVRSFNEASVRGASRGSEPPQEHA